MRGLNVGLIGMSPVTSRKTPAASNPSSGRPTTRAAQVTVTTAAQSPVSPYASAPSLILSDKWALSNDPVADGFSDIIPEGPPTFTIAVVQIMHISNNI